MSTLPSFEPTLESLGREVSELSQKVAEYLKTHNIQPPSFEESSAAFYPKESECQIARLELLSKLQDLTTLALGPGEYLTSHIVYTSTDALTLMLLQKLDFFNAVPLEGSSTYKKISDHTKVPESLVRRILRYAMTMRLFAEDESNSERVIHTAITAHAVRNPEFQAWLWHIGVCQPALQTLPDVLKRLYADGRQEVSEVELESAFCLLDIDNTGKPTTHFEFLKRDCSVDQGTSREVLFSQAMDAGRHMPGLHVEHLIQSSFDWGALGESTVVDIGGSGGHDAMVLAQNFPKLQLIVQDRPEQKAAFDRTIPSALKSRVTFQPHDFFSPQPIQDASVYILKNVLHDWPDSKAVEILQHVASVIKHPHQRIIVYENAVLPRYDLQGRPYTPVNIERTISAMDLFMLTMGNGKERTLSDWKTLVGKVGSDLELVHNHSLPGVTASFLEIALK